MMVSKRGWNYTLSTPLRTGSNVAQNDEHRRVVRMPCGDLGDLG